VNALLNVGKVEKGRTRQSKLFDGGALWFVVDTVRRTWSFLRAWVGDCQQHSYNRVTAARSTPTGSLERYIP
jgi:hypothetical protein